VDDIRDRIDRIEERQRLLQADMFEMLQLMEAVLAHQPPISAAED
jgi:hypothetical protein